jgi:hypothetical protein
MFLYRLQKPFSWTACSFRGRFWSNFAIPFAARKPGVEIRFVDETDGIGES